MLYPPFYQKKPSDIVNIRAIGTEAYQVIDTETNEVLEKIEESKAFFQVILLLCCILYMVSCLANCFDMQFASLWKLFNGVWVLSLDEFFCLSDLSNHELSTSNLLQVHEGAVYLRQGKTYLVKDLDLSLKIAWCKEADLKYYTKTRDYTDVQVIGGDMVHNLFLVLIPTPLFEGFSPLSACVDGFVDESNFILFWMFF